MPQVKDIEVINIDEQTYAVSAMSEQIQGMVAIFNEWNQKDADARDVVAMVQAAKNELSRQIIAAVRAEQEAADAEESAEEVADITDEVEGTGDGEA
jgi:hypothetical protein